MTLLASWICSIAHGSVLLLDFESDSNPELALVATEAVRQGLQSRQDLDSVEGFSEFSLRVPTPQRCSVQCLQQLSKEHGVSLIIKGSIDTQDQFWAQVTLIDITADRVEQQELAAAEFSELLTELRAESLTWDIDELWQLEKQPVATQYSAADESVFAFVSEREEKVPHSHPILAFLGRTQPVTRTSHYYEMRLIQPGTFVMGTPQNEVPNQHLENQHLVQISYPFYMGATEFDLKSWNALYEQEYSGSNLPVASMSKREAMILANDLSQVAGFELCYRSSKEGLTFIGVQCSGYRLPTEAEWEYAARAGQYQTYVGGDLIDPVGWYQGNTNQLQPVGRKWSNPLGLYDMSGNLCEWIQDDWMQYPRGKGWSIDPVAQPEREQSSQNMCRGGSWKDSKVELRAAARRKTSTISAEFLGARFVRTVLE